MHGTLCQICLCSWDSNMEIPSSDSFSHPSKIGFLLKLIGKGWLYSGTWKKRYCVLDGTKFYFYENEHSKGSEKSCGVISLDYYDVCEEYDVKDKKNPHAFVIGTSVRGFFDNRHQFSADSAEEMRAWMRAVQQAVSEARANRRKSGRRRTTQEAKSPDLSSSSQESDGTISTACLVNANKGRAKGPQGRRLPQRKSMFPGTQTPEAADIRQRSISLSSPEAHNQENELSPPSEGKWLSLSMEDMDREQKDLSPEDSSPQKSSSTFDLPKKHEDHEDHSPQRPYQQKKSAHLGKLGGQHHAALTKELEMRLKIGPRRHSPQDDREHEVDSRGSDNDSRKEIEALKAKVDSNQRSINLLEEKVCTLTAAGSKAADQNSTAEDMLQSIASTLKEAERVTEECKQALSNAERARDEHQALMKECRKELEKLKNASVTLSNGTDLSF